MTPVEFRMRMYRTHYMSEHDSDGKQNIHYTRILQQKWQKNNGVQLLFAAAKIKLTTKT